MNHIADIVSHHPAALRLGAGVSYSPKPQQRYGTQEEGAKTIRTAVNRYALLLLVKKAGKRAGFSAKMIALLDYYMAFTRDLDWEEGAAPIVYQSLSKTALDLDVSERQIQRLEKQLFEAGAIYWRDSGNHRRYGQRDPKTGRILYAFGVDLSPLAKLAEKLEGIVREKQQQDKAWMEKKRQISWYRRQITAALQEAEASAAPVETYKAIAKPIRTYMAIDELAALLEQHKAFLACLNKAREDGAEPAEHGLKAVKMSCADDKNVVHKESTTQKPSDKSEGVYQVSSGAEESPNTHSVEHVHLKHLLMIASPRFKIYQQKSDERTNWQDLADSAFRFKGELKISQQLWSEACQILGVSGAIVSLILTDHALHRRTNAVKNGPGYFKAMLLRAKEGKLHLHQSVFKMLRDESLIPNFANA